MLLLSTYLPLLFSLVSQGVVAKLEAKGKEPIRLKADKGWQEFTFGDFGSSLAFVLPKDLEGEVQVSLTDAYCTGDSWEVHVNGMHIGSTPDVPYDECETYSKDPDQALVDSRWSSLVFSFVAAPKTKLELVVANAPLKGGHAFIKIDTIIRQCSGDSPNFFLLTSPLVDRSEAKKLCKEVGGAELATIDESNKQEALSVMTQCTEGSEAGHIFAWVSSKRGRQCTVFTNTGELVNKSCHSRLPVLCMKRQVPQADLAQPDADSHRSDVDTLDAVIEGGKSSSSKSSSSKSSSDKSSSDKSSSDDSTDDSSSNNSSDSSSSDSSSDASDTDSESSTVLEKRNCLNN